MVVSANLLSLPNEILELIIEQYLNSLEISVRYPYGRGINRQHRLQHGAALLLVCRNLHKLTMLLFYERITFGHHAAHLLKKVDDPFSLVLAPANLPMDRFKHICMDFEYACGILKMPGLWPWSDLKSLVLVDYSLGERRALDQEVVTRYSALKDLQAICTVRKVQLSAYVGLGSRQAVRLRLVDSFRTLYADPPIHIETEPYQRTFQAQEVRAFVDASGLLEFSVVGDVQEKLFRALQRWFKSALMST